MYRSSNIHQIRGRCFDVVLCAGIKAVKWYANSHPEEDAAGIRSLCGHLETVRAQHFVLISTIDVYPSFSPPPQEADLPDVALQDAYGRNRYRMEEWCRARFEHCHILRLPALFGRGLKKNFLYDWLHPLPSVIRAEKWVELRNALTPQELQVLLRVYRQDSQGNWALERQAEGEAAESALHILRGVGFTALSFTDSRSEFPFFDLNCLPFWVDWVLRSDVPLLNVAVEPLSCSELVRACFGKNFTNILDGRRPLYYNMKTAYSADGSGYLQRKAEIIERLKRFFRGEGV